MKATRRVQRLLIAAIVLLPVTGAVALATPGIGIVSAPVHARGTNAELLNVHSKAGVKLKTKSSVDFVTQELPGPCLQGRRELRRPR